MKRRAVTPPHSHDLASHAWTELKAMARQGGDHRLTRPVLIGGVLGAIAGMMIDALSWEAGLFGGAAIAFFAALRR